MHETALIGAIIKKPEILVDVVGIVSTADFKNLNAGKVYNAILGMWAENKPIDLVTVFSAVGVTVDASWLVTTTDNGMAVNAPTYAQKVADDAKLRRLKSGIDSIKQLDNHDMVLAGLADLHDQEIGAPLKSSRMTEVLARFESHVSENEKRGRLGIDTGFDFLRNKWITFDPGHVWMIGAFPGVGKTSIMIELVSRLYESGNPSIAIISAEMTEEQLTARLLANLTGIYGKKILAGALEEDEKKRVAIAKKYLASKNLYIFDDVFETNEIERTIKKLDMQGGIDAFIVDYVQNCYTKGAKTSNEGQAEMAKSFQRLAKKTRSTAICLSQLPNDADEGPVVKYKGAGEWNAVTDIGILLRKAKDRDGVFLWEGHKNRHGPVCKQVMQYTDGWTRIQELHDPLNR